MKLYLFFSIVLMVVVIAISMQAVSSSSESSEENNSSGEKSKDKKKEKPKNLSYNDAWRYCIHSAQPGYRGRLPQFPSEAKFEHFIVSRNVWIGAKALRKPTKKKFKPKEWAWIDQFANGTTTVMTPMILRDTQKVEGVKEDRKCMVIKKKGYLKAVKCDEKQRTLCEFIKKAEKSTTVASEQMTTAAEEITTTFEEVLTTQEDTTTAEEEDTTTTADEDMTTAEEDMTTAAKNETTDNQEITTTQETTQEETTMAEEDMTTLGQNETTESQENTTMTLETSQENSTALQEETATTPETTTGSCSFTSSISNSYVNSSSQADPCSSNDCTTSPCNCTTPDATQPAFFSEVCLNYIAISDENGCIVKNITSQINLNCSDGVLSASNFNDDPPFFPQFPEPINNVVHIACAISNGSAPKLFVCP